MSKADKLRAIGSCVPVFLMLDTLLCYKEFKVKEHTEDDLSEIDETIIACNEEITGHINALPIYYRSSAAKKAKGVAKEINKHFVKQKFNTGKSFMAIHAWIYSLVEEGLIDIINEGYLSFIQKYDETVTKGIEHGHVEEGKEYKPDDMKAKYRSAEKHVQKMHDIAMDSDLFIEHVLLEKA